MTKSVTKSKSTSECVSQTGLSGSGDQVTALHGLNQQGGNAKEQRKKAPATGQKGTSFLKKGVTIEKVQTKLSSVLPSTSLSTSSSPIFTEPLFSNVERGAKSKVSQASKKKLAKGEKTIKRHPIVNSPNTRSRNSREKDVTSPAICVIPSKSLPKKGKSKGKGKDPEEHCIQRTIPGPHRLSENNLSISHLLTASTPPFISSPPKSTQLLSKPPPKGQPQSKKHRTITLTTSLLPPLPLPLTSPPPSLIPVAPKLLKRFYEALILLTVFGSNRGSRILEEESPTDTFDDEILDIDVNKKHEMDEMSRTKLRRSFTRHLAYLCDYEKGGDSTTAIALQQMNKGVIVYHVAWNRCSRPERGVEFLKKVLGLLGGAGYDWIKDFEKKREDIEARIFELSVKYAEKRISSYASFLARDIKFVLREWKTIREDKQDKESSTHLHAWLQGLLSLTRYPSQLCRFCHKTCTTVSQEFTHLQLLIKLGSPFATRFTQIRHTIGRLNHTPKAIQILLSTRNRLPHLFTQLTISLLPSSSSFPPPLQARNPTLSALIGRTTSDPLAITSYRAALAEMDHKYQLSTHLSSHCTNPNWRPKIHAELLLLQHFHSRNLHFVDNDRYIACSKPACYCCYHYIRVHPGKFVVPGSHCNHYLNWRAPDVEEGDERGEKIREGVLIEMSRVFRGEVLMQIKEMREPGGWKPDSLTEISEVRGRGGMGCGSFVGNEMGGVGGDGIEDEDEDCESAVGDDEEEDCESLVGEYEEEEEEDDDDNNDDDKQIRNEHFDFSQTSRENEGTPHQQHQNMSEADYHSGDTSEEEDGGVSLYF
ncbi:uncharacterized protein EAE97_008862 [Botrytis byssoidea]|uniref:Uncharacterized protein n=1 Tax=Botrytis byssoidea TaxID=139641 RepID=A0A9P5M177_9HELO|nr:uncharacterized protein EAE97_008862 [Botrytis byssoidea]KAF7933095.1 hypothetical protein EAE97_008862 [Botrytis byssoidea]